MGLRLADFMTGASKVAVPGLMIEHRQKILAEREQALANMRQKYRTGERIAGQDFRTERDDIAAEAKLTAADDARGYGTKEREAEEKASSIEKDLDRKSREKVKGMGVSGASAKRKRFISNKDGLYDTETEAWVEAPKNNKDRAKMILDLQSDLRSPFEERSSGEILKEATEIVDGLLATKDAADVAGAEVPDDLPDPMAAKGRTVTDTDTGKRYKSDGTSWKEI